MFPSYDLMTVSYLVVFIRRINCFAAGYRIENSQVHGHGVPRTRATRFGNLVEVE